jgi:hypothetical protein
LSVVWQITFYAFRYTVLVKIKCMCTLYVVRSKCTVTYWFKYLLTALSVFSSYNYWSLYEEDSFSSISSLETLQKNNHIFLVLFFHNEDIKIYFSHKKRSGQHEKQSFYLYYIVILINEHKSDEWDRIPSIESKEKDFRILYILSKNCCSVK